MGSDSSSDSSADKVKKAADDLEVPERTASSIEREETKLEEKRQKRVRRAEKKLRQQRRLKKKQKKELKEKQKADQLAREQAAIAKANAPVDLGDESSDEGTIDLDHQVDLEDQELEVIPNTELCVLGSSSSSSSSDDEETKKQKEEKAREELAKKAEAEKKNPLGP